MNESMVMMMGKETEEEKKQNQNQNHTKTTATWGTWEELLLACAVKRHGFKNWDLVAMEVQARSCLPQILTTPDVCQQKYHDLNRRFTTTATPTPTTIVPAATTTAPKEHTGEKRGDSYFNNNNNNININNSNNNNNNERVDNTTTTTTSSATKSSGGGAGGGDGEQAANIPWLEELRKLRVAELKQEVHRYDASILSLQLEVKRLVEEREKSVSLQDNKIQIQIQTKPSEQQQQQRQQEQKPDLNDADDDRSDNNHKSDDHHHRFLLKPCISPDESDRENRSVNESNSTASEDKGGAVVKLLDADAAQAASVQQATSPVTEIGRDESYEVDDSVTQLSSEAQSQSSASLGRKRKREDRRNRVRRKEVGGGGGGGDDFKGMLVPVESEPLIGLLDLIRAHRHGSFFESRHQAQESESYKSIVRQHMDLETLQAKLDQGFYTSHLPFHRDLHLLFNNAAVFFPKSSVESLAAQELQSLILPVLRKETIKSDTILEQPTPSIPTPHTAELEGSDSLLAKHNSPVPIAVSRKRSSMSAKPSTSSSLGQKNEQQQKEDKAVSAQKPPVVEQASLNMKSKEKPVTGVRSSRRSNKNFAKVTNTPGKRQSTTSPVMKDGKVDKAESSKSERKKIEPSATDKKRSAANFLKRIKKNSPGETLKKNNKGGGDGSGESKRDNGGKGDRGKETVLRKNSNRRQVKEESSPVRRTTAGPSKKVTEASKGSSKRVREGGRKETEDVAKKPRKRSRR